MLRNADIVTSLFFYQTIRLLVYVISAMSKFFDYQMQITKWAFWVYFLEIYLSTKQKQHHKETIFTKTALKFQKVFAERIYMDIIYLFGSPLH